jgi:hypothetical protein
MVLFFEAFLGFHAPSAVSAHYTGAESAKGAKFYSTARGIAINPGISWMKKGARSGAPILFYFQYLKAPPCQHRMKSCL